MINEIKHLFPNADPLADFELRDNSDGQGPFISRWDTVKLGARPTTQQLAAVSVAAAQTAANAKQSRLRAAAYPPVTDYLDGIVKGDAAQVQAYIAVCLAVKAKYPKGIA